MITSEFLSELVDDCHNEKDEMDGGAELCAGCPLGSLCSEVASAYKCVQL